MKYQVKIPSLSVTTVQALNKVSFDLQGHAVLEVSFPIVFSPVNTKEKRLLLAWKFSIVLTLLQKVSLHELMKFFPIIQRKKRKNNNNNNNFLV